MSKTMDSDDEDKPNIKLIAVLDHDAAVPITDEMDTEPSTNNIDGYCTECEDQPTQLFCEQCQDDFCDVCFQSIHRKGTRKKHTTKKLVSKYSNTTSNGINSKMSKEVSETSSASQFSSPVIIKGAIGDWFINRSKYIPLRLTYQERKYLRLLEAALNVSEYTDKIDIVSYTSKAKRIVAQIKELCSILSGLVLAADYKIGQELFKNRDFAQNKNFFQDIFELGRRHKIMNPEKMRESYGKLLYLLQDSQMPEIKEMLEFDCVIPIKTVYKVLEENGCLEVLSDEIIVTATQEIITSPGKSRNVIQNEIRQKERSIEILSKKYEKKNISADLIKQCLYSIGDNHSFLRANRDPCDQMIGN
ncbi:hypothetical protein HK099_003599 [Clydaea vesicula]|uniref:B box-type domain-containing protein n=1 Tax=Clydaea vesicula TaxID=447962 RepID=A0AAD5U1V4_9FUNG|nr:hypothetical protein HK099_003599 [Clydaea vesicula]